MKQKTEAQIRGELSADLSSFVQTLPGGGDRRYIPHGIIRALLNMQQATSDFDYEYAANVQEHPDGWMAVGTLRVHWPVLVNGALQIRTAVYQDVSDLETNPAAATSRLFVRMVAFYCGGLGLEAWDPRAASMQRIAIGRKTQKDRDTARKADAAEAHLEAVQDAPDGPDDYA